MLPCFEFKTATETGLLQEDRMYYPTPPQYWSDIKRVVYLGWYRNSQSYRNVYEELDHCLDGAWVKVAYLQLVVLDIYETCMLDDLHTWLSHGKPGEVLFKAIQKSIDNSWVEWCSHFQELRLTEMSYVLVFNPDDPTEPEW
ncbi:hypothetical protein B0H21DRAFT_711941 [Amylocystis lapponica]|nr:hypothetical protein B0H21DRAFT_711941 [Amylocystis lapponica]